VIRLYFQSRITIEASEITMAGGVFRAAPENQRRSGAYPQSGISTILFKMKPGAVLTAHEHTALEKNFASPKNLLGWRKIDKKMAPSGARALTSPSLHSLRTKKRAD
jgi:hypothetical protein